MKSPEGKHWNELVFTTEAYMLSVILLNLAKSQGLFNLTDSRSGMSFVFMVGIISFSLLVAAKDQQNIRKDRESEARKKLYTEKYQLALYKKEMWRLLVFAKKLLKPCKKENLQQCLLLSLNM